jgi:hypothetical protein
MHLDVKTCAQPRIPLLPCEMSGHHLGTNFSHPQFLSQYLAVSRFMFTSSAIILFVNR